MSIKTKIMTMMTFYPKLLIFGVGLATTFVIGAAIGLFDSHHVFALGVSGHDNDIDQELKRIDDLIFS